jgi:hypothetical protein
LSLAPGSFVREHCDAGLGYEDGEVRIHIPIQTNYGVEFYSGGRLIRMEEGHCYYVNVSLPHRVANRGSEARIHLVIDADVNGWVDELFRQGRDIPMLPAAVGSFEQFRGRVLAEPELQAKLHAVSQRALYTDATVQLGRDLGFHFDAFDVGTTAVAEDRAESASIKQSANWVPVAVHVGEGRPTADWVYVGNRRFVEPFFEDTIRIALRNPFARDFRQRASIPIASRPTPSGFIFHMSRCGSTLISQMFAALPRVVMLSEVPPIDEVIQSTHIESQADCLKSLVAGLAQPRTGSEEHCIVKLDAWHIHKLPLIRAAFPTTPWVFVYRDPLEVLISQLRQPGRLGAPGAMNPESLGLRIEDITELNREAWCVRVLAGFLRAALAHRHIPGGLFVNYSQLPEAVGEISRHFGIVLQDGESQQMLDAARFDSKSPSRPFQNDSEEKRNEAPAPLRKVVASTLSPLYAELEAWAASVWRF